MPRTRTTLHLVLAAGLACGLAACQREQLNDPAAASRPVADRVTSNTAAPASATAPGDPSLPAHDSAMNSAATPATDGNNTALTPGERDRAMPLEGHNHSYNSDAFAKRGDEAVPREPAPGARTSMPEAPAAR